METEARPATWKILLAFSMIYFVWGSTFLAIRVGVHEVPPFLLAAVRFFTAGLVMYAWLRLKGTPAPVPREWTAASALGALIFVVDYGCLFWAEQRVPSGIAAVVLATIPVFITLMEIIFLRTQRLTVRLSLALIIGLFGVAVLMNHSFSFAEVPVNRAGAIALLVASATWSIATVYTRRLPLPASKPMSAATQMLSGGAMLFVLTAVTGEFTGFHAQAVSGRAWFARSISSSLVQLSDSPLTSGCCTTSRRRRWEPTHMSIRWSRSVWDIFSAEKRLVPGLCWELCWCW